MNAIIKKAFTFLTEPATYHFLVALVILLVSFVSKADATELQVVAGFFGITGLITYNANDNQ